ncbi:MAG: hypothetical protein ABS939_00735 [Psychrobacillus sp.]
MSSTLEYNRKIYRDGKSILFLCKQGDINVWDVANKSLRSRQWSIRLFGTEEEYWNEIGNSLRDVRGGMLQRAVGWSDFQCFDVNEYVSLYRSKLLNAKPLQSAFEDFSFSYTICLDGFDDLKWQAGLLEFDVPYLEGFYQKSGKLQNTEELIKWFKFFPKYFWKDNQKIYIRITSKKYRQ